ncbi:MAG: histidine phosphatase family protein [Lachnospiraceae bacterium]|nr:histidine phosphatase family protein [Lachnospiraceae bacterium]
MKLYLIRHGETDWNKVRRLQGQSDIPLNDFGRKLAMETAPALRDVPFDLAITSPLLRAKETAELVLAGRNVPMREEPRLMELAFGEYEGLICKGEQCNITDPDFHYFHDAPDKYVPPRGGESFYDLQRRLKSFLEELFADPALQDATILISTHGGVMCMLFTLFKGRPLAEMWGHGVHKNCGVSLVEVKDGEPKVIFENRTFYSENVEDW